MSPCRLVVVALQRRRPTPSCRRRSCWCRSGSACRCRSWSGCRCPTSRRCRCRWSLWLKMTVALLRMSPCRLVRVPCRMPCRHRGAAGVVVGAGQGQRAGPGLGQAAGAAGCHRSRRLPLLTVVRRVVGAGEHERADPDIGQPAGAGERAGQRAAADAARRRCVPPPALWVKRAEYTREVPGSECRRSLTARVEPPAAEGRASLRRRAEGGALAGRRNSCCRHCSAA